MISSAKRVLAPKQWLADMPQPSLDTVGCAEHHDLAFETAARSITLVRDEANLLPLRPSSVARLATVVPQPFDLTPADTSSYVTCTLAQTLRQYHPPVQEFVVPHAPSDADIAALRQQISDHDLVIVGTITAFKQSNQATLVNALLETGVPMTERSLMSFLQNEIRQQPQVLTALLDREIEDAQRIAADLRARGVKYCIIAARGTSDNAARYAQYLFGAYNRLPVGLATPSLFSVYGQPPRLEDGLVIGISQSGQSPDIVAVLEEGQRQGAPTLAVTNDPDSPLAAQADYVIPLHAGEERAVAATKTYTAQLTALALLSCTLGDDLDRLAALRRVPLAVGRVLDREELIASAVERYRYMETCVVIGRGYNYATAFEIALKLIELNHLTAEAYSSADFMHGPIAVVDSGFPVLIVAPSGKMFDTLRDFTLELKSRGAELLIISDQQDLLTEAVTPLPLRERVPEWLSPITAIVLGQLFALHLTLAKGHDPDQPPGLRKVTLTR